MNDRATVGLREGDPVEPGAPPGMAGSPTVSGAGEAGKTAAPPAYVGAGVCAVEPTTIIEGLWAGELSPLLGRFARATDALCNAQERAEVRFAKAEFRRIAERLNRGRAPSQRTDEIRVEFRETCRAMARVARAALSGSSQLANELEPATERHAHLMAMIAALTSAATP